MQKEDLTDQLKRIQEELKQERLSPYNAKKKLWAE